MPSPFPGMDPFLEHSAIFPGLHDRFITYLCEMLQHSLPEPYFAEIDETLRVEATDRSIGPDEIRETYLEIRTPVDQTERVVTTIDVLSPTNKTPEPNGQELYQQKQREVLQNNIHLVEIDLLRGGLHATAVPLEELHKQSPPFDYHVCVHQFDQPGKFVIYPIGMEQRLPEIEIPLLPGDAPVKARLQAVFDRCYEMGPYRRRLRYDIVRLVPVPPEPKLEWVKAILQKQPRQ